MALGLNRLFLKQLVSNNKLLVRHKSQRRSLGKPPGVARSLKQRIDSLEYKDPTIHYKVNIGYAIFKPTRREGSSEHTRILKENRVNSELEQLSRDNKLIIPLEEVEKEWANTVGPSHIKAIAEHYSIYDHLFGYAYFYPVVNLNVHFEDEGHLFPVYRGNPIKPLQTRSSPIVTYKSTKESLWTIVLTTPDGHLNSNKLEYVHWFIGNIKGNDLKTGQIVHDYIQTLPLKGLGYLRYVLILYKQDKMIDYSNITRKSFSGDLNERNFSTYEFYKTHQNYITPAGLSFFTADWDYSVTEFYNKTIKSDCPEFVYDFPKHYYKKQVWFPLKQPFNLYLDRYRDEKEIAKEYLVKKLKNLDPFKDKSHEKLMFPNAVPFKRCTPSWLKNELRKERLGQARANDYE